ncbi:hypothetical protein ACQCX2_13515 [Propionibacteriaceae bacterium Y1700]|uniref:hypothetical protein n=1 Tax=Microlunatus sp. Y1700 TaxID=3418487 RepID=UPI003DA6DE16
MNSEANLMAQELITKANTLADILRSSNATSEAAFMAELDLHNHLTLISVFIEGVEDDEADEPFVRTGASTALLRVQFREQLPALEPWEIWGGQERALAHAKTLGDIAWVASSCGRAEDPTPVDDADELAQFTHESSEFEMW